MHRLKQQIPEFLVQMSKDMQTADTQEAQRHNKRFVPTIQIFLEHCAKITGEALVEVGSYFIQALRAVRKGHREPEKIDVVIGIIGQVATS